MLKTSAPTVIDSIVADLLFSVASISPLLLMSCSSSHWKVTPAVMAVSCCPIVCPCTVAKPNNKTVNNKLEKRSLFLIIKNKIMPNIC